MLLSSLCLACSKLASLAWLFASIRIFPILMLWWTQPAVCMSRIAKTNQYFFINGSQRLKWQHTMYSLAQYFENKLKRCFVMKCPADFLEDDLVMPLGSDFDGRFRKDIDLFHSKMVAYSSLRWVAGQARLRKWPQVKHWEVRNILSAHHYPTCVISLGVATMVFDKDISMT